MAQTESISAASRAPAAPSRSRADARHDALADSDLLALVARGDHDALGVIYDRQIPAVWKVALHFSASRAAAEQAVAEAFLRLWRRPRADDPASLAARLLASVAREARKQRPVTGAQA